MPSNSHADTDPRQPASVWGQCVLGLPRPLCFCVPNFDCFEHKQNPCNCPLLLPTGEDPHFTLDGISCPNALSQLAATGVKWQWGKGGRDGSGCRQKGTEQVFDDPIGAHQNHPAGSSSQSPLQQILQGDKLRSNVIVTTNRARAKGTENPRKKWTIFSITEEKNTLCPHLNHNRSKPTMQTVQNYPHTMVLRAGRIFRLCETKLLFHQWGKQSLMRTVNGGTITTKALCPVPLSDADAEGPLLLHDQKRIWPALATEHSRAQPETGTGRKYLLLNSVSGGVANGMVGQTRDRSLAFPNQYVPLPSLNTNFTTWNEPNVFLFPHVWSMAGIRNTKICHLNHLWLKRAERNMNSHSHTPVPHSFQRLTSQVFLLFGFAVSKPKGPLWQWREAAGVC